MSRTHLITACAVLVLATLCCACGSETEGEGAAAALSNEEARALVIRASAMPKEQLEAIVELGAAIQPDGLASIPLTSALLLVPLDREASEDFHWLKGNATTPRDIASGFQELEGGLISVVNEKTVTSVTWEETGAVAEGTVVLEVPDVLKARFGFRAVKKDDAWQVNEFTCPPISFKTTLGADGRWVYSEGK